MGSSWPYGRVLDRTSNPNHKEIDAMPTTGQTCSQSGIYEGRCNNQHVKEIALSNGNTFPPCHTSGCSGSVTWTLKTPTR